MNIDENTNLKKSPICDTDIWVDIILAKIDPLLFEKHGMIVVADVVEKEILCFDSNPYFKVIATKFLEYKSAGKIFVINHTDINRDDRILLEKQLIDCDNRFQTGLADYPHEEHKGEIVSAIYADYLKLPFLKSNDGAFKEGNIGRTAFPDLIVKDRKQTIYDLVTDSMKRHECFQLIADNRALMNEGKRIYTQEIASDDQIFALLNKWKKH